MKKTSIKEGFYADTHKSAIKKLNPDKGEYYSFTPASGYSSVEKFDKERKFNDSSIYNIKKNNRGIKTAISRLEDIWYNIERILWRGDTTDRNDVKSIKSFWPKYVREYNALMKKLNEVGALEIKNIDDDREHPFVSLIGNDFGDWDDWFKNYNPYHGSWVEKAMRRGDSNGGSTWGELLKWSPKNYDLISIINDSYKVSFVYRVTPVKYSGRLNENARNITIKISSGNRLNRRQILEKTQKYFKKNYGIFVESLDVSATGEVSGDSLKLIHNVIETSIPTHDVYERVIEDGEHLNKVEAKKLIDNILTGDITDMIGSSESMMQRVVTNLKDLEEKGAKVYRIYKDGYALGTFIKKVCKIERTRELEFYGDNIKETLKMIASVPEAACDVNLISCENDYCLVLVIEK